jgi:hypothetical protein
MLLMVIIGLIVWLINLFMFRSQWFRYRNHLKNRGLELSHVLSTPLVLFGIMLFTFGHFFIILNAFELLHVPQIFFKYVFFFSMLTPFAFIYYLGRHLPENHIPSNSNSLGWVFMWPVWCSLLGFIIIYRKTLFVSVSAEIWFTWLLAILSQCIPVIIFFILKRHSLVKADT